MVDDGNGVMGYASRTGTRHNLDVLRDHGWRLMVSAQGALRSEGFKYALDNGAWHSFQQSRPFDCVKFRRALDLLGSDADFVVAPDIVEGGRESLLMSCAWLDELRQRCRLVLIAVQDGMTPDMIRPLLAQDVGLFIGGSTQWKERSLPGWGRLARDARAYLHVGRVNSRRRIKLCALAGADSFDGSGPSRFAKIIPTLDAEVRQRCLILV